MTKWTMQEMLLYMRMHPNEPKRRREIAERLAPDYPNIAHDVGEEYAQVVRYWFEALGVSVQVEEVKKQDDSWSEVWRLAKRYFRQCFNIPELLQNLIKRLLRLR